MIRLANLADLDAINTIFNQAVEAKHQTAALTPITDKQRLKWFQEHETDRYPIFILEVDNKVIGWYSLSPYRKGREAFDHLAEVTYYLHKDFQRKGYGTKLLNHAINTAPKYSFTMLIAILYGHNTASVRLLEKFNFERWGDFPKIALVDGKYYDHTFYGLKL